MSTAGSDGTTTSFAPPESANVTFLATAGLAGATGGVTDDIRIEGKGATAGGAPGDGFGYDAALAVGTGIADWVSSDTESRGCGSNGGSEGTGRMTGEARVACTGTAEDERLI